MTQYSDGRGKNRRERKAIKRQEAEKRNATYAERLLHSIFGEIEEAEIEEARVRQINHDLPATTMPLVIFSTPEEPTN